MTLNKWQKTIIVNDALDKIKTYLEKGIIVNNRKAWTKAYHILDLWLNMPMKHYTIKRAKGNYYNPNNNPLAILTNKEGFNIKLIFDTLTFIVCDICIDKA